MKVQTFSRIFASMVVLGAIAACDARPQSELGQGQSLLEIFAEDGPDVKGVSDTLLTTARQAEEAKDYNRALQFYQQLVDKYPDNLAYQLGMANNLRRIGQADKAVLVYNRILARNPHHVVALEGKGLAQIAKAEFPQASETLEKVMQLDRNRWRTLNGVGLLFVAKSMPREAISYFDAALAIKPDHPSVLNNAGLTLALNRDYQRAVAALNRASSKVNSRSAERQRIDLNLALVLGLSGDMKRAEQVASRHLSDAALQNNMGFYAKLAGDEDLAKAYLNSALSGSSTFYERAWENLEAVN